MNDLFNRKDILTIATADKAVIGTKGFFGDCLPSLAIKIKQSDIETLTDVTPDVTYCFESNNDLQYMFFLPLDKAKEKVKEPVYRPIKTIDELFHFLVPSFTADYNTFDKVDIIFNSVFELKGKNSGCIYYKKFTSIRVTTDYGIVLDAYTLDHYFENYEIEINGEWVPFGIKEE